MSGASTTMSVNSPLNSSKWSVHDNVQLSDYFFFFFFLMNGNTERAQCALS